MMSKIKQEISKKMREHLTEMIRLEIGETFMDMKFGRAIFRMKTKALDNLSDWDINNINLAEKWDSESILTWDAETQSYSTTTPIKPYREETA